MTDKQFEVLYKRVDTIDDGVRWCCVWLFCILMMTCSK